MHIYEHTCTQVETEVSATLGYFWVSILFSTHFFPLHDRQKILPIPETFPLVPRVTVSSSMLPGPTEIPNVINATVTMIVKVTHRNFTSDLKNTSSEAYKNFQNLFLSQVGAVTVKGGLWVPTTYAPFVSQNSEVDSSQSSHPSALPHSAPSEGASAAFLSLSLGSTHTSLELSKDGHTQAPYDLWFFSRWIKFMRATTFPSTKKWSLENCCEYWGAEGSLFLALLLAPTLRLGYQHLCGTGELLRVQTTPESPDSFIIISSWLVIHNLLIHSFIHKTCHALINLSSIHFFIIIVPHSLIRSQFAHSFVQYGHSVVYVSSVIVIHLLVTDVRSSFVLFIIHHVFHCLSCLFFHHSFTYSFTFIVIDFHLANFY